MDSNDKLAFKTAHISLEAYKKILQLFEFSETMLF